MAVRQLSPDEPFSLVAFVELERAFMDGYPLFWSPTDMDVLEQLSGRSPLFCKMERALFIAEHEGRPVARCVASIGRDRPAIDRRGGTTGFVGYFAARSDAAIATAELLAVAEEWLARRGVSRIVAPHNGSVKIGMAVLTDAFHESPMFPLPWNPPYYSAYLLNSGYRPRFPLWVYEINFKCEAYRKATAEMAGRPRCDLRWIDLDNWANELEALRDLVNRCFNVECTIGQIEELLRPVTPIVDARLIQFGLHNGRPIGFIVGSLDLVPLRRALRGLKGAAVPVESGPARVGLIAGALLPEYRGKHIGWMAARYLRDLEDMGFKEALYLPVNGSNGASRGLVEAIGGRGRVLYHCYEKFI